MPKLPRKGIKKNANMQVIGALFSEKIDLSI
jgi:hypothetical protein